jgi:hypothetical protein
VKLKNYWKKFCWEEILLGRKIYIPLKGLKARLKNQEVGFSEIGQILQTCHEQNFYNFFATTLRIDFLFLVI